MLSFEGFFPSVRMTILVRHADNAKHLYGLFSASLRLCVKSYSFLIAAMMFTRLARTAGYQAASKATK